MITKIKNLFLIVSLAFILACSKTEPPEKIQEIQEEEEQVLDSSPPEIEFTISEKIETFSKYELKVNDASIVHSKIFVNDELLLETDLNSLTEEFNPYPISVGQTVVKVVSEDESGNTSSIEKTIDIKHLLLDFSMSSLEYTLYDNWWVFFNDLNGNLIDVKQVFNSGEKIYTEELFYGETLFYTIANYTNSVFSSNVSSIMRLNTYILRPGKTRFPKIEPPEIDLTKVQEIEVEYDAPVDPKFNLDAGRPPFNLQANGTEYENIGNRISGNSEYYSLNYANPEVIILRTSIFNGPLENDGIFDGKKENYLYYPLKPASMVSTPKLQKSELNKASNYQKFTLPDHDLGSFGFGRNAYEDEYDVKEGIFHLIYVMAEGDGVNIDYIDLPILDEFTLYGNIMSFKKDGRLYVISVFGNPSSVVVPDWSVEFGIINGSEIHLSAIGDGDYHKLSLGKGVYDNNDRVSRTLTWDYYTFTTQQDEQIIPLLQVPEILSEITEKPDFFTQEGLKINQCITADYDEFSTYEEAIDWLGNFSDEKLGVDQRTYRQMTTYAQKP